MNCPNCNNKILQPTPTPAKVVIHLCPNCRGSWFAAGDLAMLTKSAGDFERQFDRARPNGRKSDKLSPLSGLPMLEVPYRGKHPIYLCENSGGHWVEKDEMRAIVS